MSREILIACIVTFCATTMASDTNKQGGEEVLHFSSLPTETGLERRAYVEELERAGKKEALYEIACSKASWASFAISAYAKLLPDGDVLKFVESFKLGSEQWVAAAGVLDHHAKTTVIGYLRKIASSSSNEARCVCYSVCMKAGWNDLLEDAKRDLGKDDGLALPNMLFYECTIGQVAKAYIEQFENSKGSSGPSKQ